MDRVTAQLGACVEASSLSLFGFKVFMDARRLVTPEEWGSLPPKAAKFALVSLVVEVLPCKQGVEVRFLPGAPNWGQQRAAELPCKHLV